MGHPVPTRSIWKEWDTLLSEFRTQEHGAEPNGGVQRARAHSWLDSQVFMNMDNLSFCFNRFKINMDMTTQVYERFCHILLKMYNTSECLSILQDQN